MTKWAFAQSEKVEMRGHKYSAQMNRADDLQLPAFQTSEKTVTAPSCEIRRYRETD